MVAVDVTDEIQIAVIGAGISGLSFARTYLSVHLDAKLVIFERESMIGGVWSRRRVYDAFWSQGAVGYFEFSDCPMPRPPEHDMLHGFDKAEHTTSYLESYVAQHKFNGSSLLERIVFNISVDSVQRDDNQWLLQTSDHLQKSSRLYRARKLVVASGTASIPKIPHLPGFRNFGKPILHNYDFGSSQLLEDTTANKVVVLGAGKSSADMIYALVRAGKRVSWIVRPTGTGPLTLVPPEGAGPYEGAFDLGSTRLVSTLQPSLLIPRNSWTRFLHESWLGRRLLTKIWAAVETKIRSTANYHGRKSKRGFEKLEPHTPMFWQNNPAGLLNHPDFFDIVATHVDIYYDEIESLGHERIHLKSGSNIQTDALLLGTGWDHSLHYMSEGVRATLGLPYPKMSNEAERSEWDKLEKKADAVIIERFPELAQPPQHTQSQPLNEPFRLYNLISPIGDAARSIVCIGQVSTNNPFSTGEVQSLWATAYFDSNLQLPSLQEQKTDVAQFIAWNHRRYLKTGDAAINVSLETVMYNDKLLAQLGLKSHLKCQSWWSCWWSFWLKPCRSVNLAGLIREYKAQHTSAEAFPLSK